MKIVFFGTPPYVLPILETLHKEFKEKHESPIAAVVTQKPKPSGRKKLLKYSAIDEWAHGRSKPKILNSMDIINENIEADIGILAAYGELIPKKVLDYFPHGILNIHPSFLPEFRGASPVQATLATGKDQAGVTIMRMDKDLDHGPIVSQFKEEVRKNDTSETLRERLFALSAEALSGLIPAYMSGKITPKKQDHKKATFTKLIKKNDAYIDPKALDFVLNSKPFKKDWDIPFIKDYTTHYSPRTIHNFIRAMNPWPVAWTMIRIDKKSEPKRLKIISSHLKRNKLALDEVQLESKNKVNWSQFTEAYPKFRFKGIQ
jgi:methionyl-tRNA formyltransferase